jgi:LDH2 family malate/lactate/ureidoglycolate dehydrogenase
MPSSPAEPAAEAVSTRIAEPALAQFIADVLRACAVAPEQAQAVAAALTEASLRGVDSHGARLLPHYAKVARTGRINPRAQISVRHTGPGTAVLDADDGFGHWAGFAAIDEGVALARSAGIAAVAVINSSHFGAAGCYALRAAAAGCVGLVLANSDKVVLPHDAIVKFHGTNPLAFAAPVAGGRPYLLDMATSAVPWNRVQDYAVRGLPVPEDAAVDAEGRPTTDGKAAEALLPLGGVRYGFKGAGLASMLEIFSAVMTGMGHCGELLSMAGPDFATPRRLGQFYIVVDPGRFVSQAAYDAGMASYLKALRGVPAQPGREVMAPGDREWRVERERLATGIPVPGQLQASFEALAAELGVPAPAWRE